MSEQIFQEKVSDKSISFLLTCLKPSQILKPEHPEENFILFLAMDRKTVSQFRLKLASGSLKYLDHLFDT